MIFGFLLVGKQRFSRDREIAESGVHLTHDRRSEPDPL